MSESREGCGVLSEDERVALTAVRDLRDGVGARPATPATPAAVAAHACVIVQGRFGQRRASGALTSLWRRGMVTRGRREGAFVYEWNRWPTDEERG